MHARGGQGRAAVASTHMQTAVYPSRVLLEEFSAPRNVAVGSSVMKLFFRMRALIHVTVSLKEVYHCSHSTNQCLPRFEGSECFDGNCDCSDIEGDHCLLEEGIAGVKCIDLMDSLKLYLGKQAYPHTPAPTSSESCLSLLETTSSNEREDFPGRFVKLSDALPL